MIRWLVGLIGWSLAATSALAADPITIGVGYLGVAGTRSTLSLVEQPAENDGVAGARLAIEDNNTTGKFTGQRFTLEERRIKEGEDAVQAANDLAARNGFIIADLPADALLKVADALRERGTLLFNAGRSTSGCARPIAAPTSSTPRRHGRCWPMRSASIWCGRSGRAGCSWSARMTRTSCSPMR